MVKGVKVCKTSSNAGIRHFVKEDPFSIFATKAGGFLRSVMTPYVLSKKPAPQIIFVLHFNSSGLVEIIEEAESHESRRISTSISRLSSFVCIAYQLSLTRGDVQR